MTKKARASKTGVAPGYLHGFTAEEQKRLYQQARFLESSVYSKIDYPAGTHLLEIGCGVGAQTEILLERFPKLTIQGVDASAAQIKTARKHLAKPVHAGRVDFEVADALKLPHPDNSFDGAFICWLLEHVREPVEILREARRCLRTGSVIYCTEVLNSTFYLNPYSPATLQYWFAFNDHQWNLGGDPFVGGKLANYLLAAGYQNVSTEVKVLFCDNRMPKQRAAIISYWTSLLLSGAPGLLKAGRVTPKLVEQMKKELERLKVDRDSVFFYSFVQARAEAFEMELDREAFRKIYEKLGGEPGLARVLEDFYQRMSRDVLIGFFFDGKDLRQIATKQKEFLMRAMGVTATYAGKAPATAHLELAPILTGHFDRRLRILEETLRDHGLTAKDIRTWVGFEEIFRAAVTHV